MRIRSHQTSVRIEEIRWPGQATTFLTWLTRFQRTHKAVVKLTVTVSGRVNPQFSVSYDDQSFSGIARRLKDQLPDRGVFKAELLADSVGEIDSYIDEDDAALLVAGSDSFAARTCSGFQWRPMFFRRSGVPIDLVDLYFGRSVFVIGNGPSFQGVDKMLLKRPGICTFAMNNGGHLFRPDFWAAVDDPVRFLESIWTDPGIMKFIPLAHFEKPIWDLSRNCLSRSRAGDCPNVVGFRRNERFNPETWLGEETINWGNHTDLGGGRSVLLVIIRICHLLGFRNIYLLGCDFQMSVERKYWFDEDRGEEAIANSNHSYRRLRGYLAQLKSKFDAAGLRVFNSNPTSRLDVFPFKDLSEAVAENAIDLSASTRGMYVNRGP